MPTAFYRRPYASRSSHPPAGAGFGGRGGGGRARCSRQQRLPPARDAGRAGCGPACGPRARGTGSASRAAGPQAGLLAPAGAEGRRCRLPCRMRALPRRPARCAVAMNAGRRRCRAPASRGRLGGPCGQTCGEISAHGARRRRPGRSASPSGRFGATRNVFYSRPGPPAAWTTSPATSWSSAPYAAA